MRRGLALALSVLLGLAGLAGCAASSAGGLDGRADDGYYGALLPTPYVVPRVTLTDQAGAPYDLATDTTTPLTLVFFGYTHCPDVCQEVMASLASAVTRLDPADRRRVQVVFVTTDPRRDTAAVLRDYVADFDPSFAGLTGPIAGIKQLGTALGIAIEKGRRLPGGGYDVSHGSSVIGVDARHRGVLVWTQGTSSAEFASDIAQLLGRSS